MKMFDFALWQTLSTTTSEAYTNDYNAKRYQSQTGTNAIIMKPLAISAANSMWLRYLNQVLFYTYLIEDKKQGNEKISSEAS